jgi:hypothetical protein
MRTINLPNAPAAGPNGDRVVAQSDHVFWSKALTIYASIPIYAGTVAKVAELFSHRFSGWTVAAAHDDALARADHLIVGRLPGADIPSRRFQPLIGHPLVTTKRDGVMFQPRNAVSFGPCLHRLASDCRSALSG